MTDRITDLKRIDAELTRIRDTRPSGWVSTESRLVREFDTVWAQATQEEHNLFLYGVRRLEPSPSFAPVPGRPGRPRLLQKKQRRKRTPGDG